MIRNVLYYVRNFSKHRCRKHSYRVYLQGTYNWITANVMEKEGLSAAGCDGRGPIGAEIL